MVSNIGVDQAADHVQIATLDQTKQREFLFFQNDSDLSYSKQKKLVDSIVEEQGKTIVDAEGDILRGLQVVEHSCGITTLLQGETLPSISRDLDTFSYKLPLGVCAGKLDHFEL